MSKRNFTEALVVKRRSFSKVLMIQEKYISPVFEDGWGGGNKVDIGSGVNPKVPFGLFHSFDRSVSAANRFVALDRPEYSHKSNEAEGYNFSDKSLVFAGFFLFAGGAVFLYEVWWKVSFDLPTDPNIAGYAALTIVSMVLIGSGFALASCPSCFMAGVSNET
jgi:hypothetical protein